MSYPFRRLLHYLILLSGFAQKLRRDKLCLLRLGKGDYYYTFLQAVVKRKGLNSDRTAITHVAKFTRYSVNEGGRRACFRNLQ